MLKLGGAVRHVWSTLLAVSMPLTALLGGAGADAPSVTDSASAVSIAHHATSADCFTDIDELDLVGGIGFDEQRAGTDVPLGKPVVLVHGWADSGAVFEQDVEWVGTDLTTAVSAAEEASIVERLSQLDGVSLFSFDYSEQSAQWVTGQSGIDLMRAIDCLYTLSQQSVTVVAHSMGGLALRFALDGQTERGAMIDQVITLGTPNTGSDVAATLATPLETFMDVLRQPTSNVLLWMGVKTIDSCIDANYIDSWDTCGWQSDVLRPAIGMFGQAGKALRTNSSELAELAPWPSNVEVTAVAVEQELDLTSLLPSSIAASLPVAAISAASGINVLSMGDQLVSVASAIDQATDSRVFRCGEPVDIDELVPVLFSNPCFHGTMTRNLQVVNFVVSTVDASDRLASENIASMGYTVGVEAVATANRLRSVSTFMAEPNLAVSAMSVADPGAALLSVTG
ncbi:esterase/lipase family protein [Microbacterium marmarense]|uniref:GPI inositol-deacylase PGAP1-like alpha/beta domain-containing protein n=1 Tax=Microbacterium marmarense TaxID=3122051 RepID=A0ABU8LS53_9MICO